MIWIQGRGQKGRVEVTLHRSYPTGTVMPALGKRLLDVPSTSVTILRELGPASGNFEQDAARACNGALQKFDKHPWRPKPHALAILFLPRFVCNFFENNRVALRDDLMHLAPVQAPAMCCELAFLFDLAPSGFLIALALLPQQLLLARFLDPPSFVVVVRISCPPLSIHLARHSADLLFIGLQLLAKNGQARLSFSWDQGNRGGTQIRSDRISSYRVPGLVVGNPLQCQLHARSDSPGGLLPAPLDCWLCVGPGEHI
jgi:hypothetical protein